MSRRVRRCVVIYFVWVKVWFCGYVFVCCIVEFVNV